MAKSVLYTRSMSPEHQLRCFRSKEQYIWKQGTRFLRRRGLNEETNYVSTY